MNTLRLKKYSNRKLYSTETGTYVNLKEIIDVLQNGRNIEVINHKGEDVTVQVLSQVVVHAVSVNKYPKAVKSVISTTIGVIMQTVKEMEAL